jgi:prepilin peptidase CpaA
MLSNAWWPTVIVLAIATASDINSRRIPNWLVFPFLLMGMAASVLGYTAVKFVQSVEGIVLAAAIGGVLCWLRGMGLGDLKLCAAIGAWIGPDQLLFALVVTGIAGGVMALLWAAYHKRLDECLASTGDLLSTWRSGIKPHSTVSLSNPRKLKMPYAPAIAIGTIFSFFGV